MKSATQLVLGGAAECGVVLLNGQERVDDVRVLVALGDGAFEPLVAILVRQAQDPARHRDRHPGAGTGRGQFTDEGAEVTSSRELPRNAFAMIGNLLRGRILTGRGVNQSLGRPRSHAPELVDWVELLQIRPVPTAAGTGWRVNMAAAQDTAVAEVMCAALDAVNQGLWQRLRACPDCQYVFFDGSRNNTRTWCRMIREDPSGRSCGNLAKVRAKRARDRAATPASSM